MLKFGGSRPESDGNDAKDPLSKERRQRHQRTAAAVAAVAGTSAVPGTVGIAGPIETTPNQMAPPESPFGTGQPPVVGLF